jgi:hypothetical protein
MPGAQVQKAGFMPAPQVFGAPGLNHVKTEHNGRCLFMCFALSCLGEEETGANQSVYIYICTYVYIYIIIYIYIRICIQFIYIYTAVVGKFARKLCTICKPLRSCRFTKTVIVMSSDAL